MDRSSPTGLQDHISKEIRVLLIRRDMTAENLAEKLGWSPSQLSRKLTGQTEFNVGDLDKVARAFKISLIDLLPADAGSTWNTLLNGAAA